MTCPSCGFEVPSSFRYCGSCGCDCDERQEPEKKTSILVIAAAMVAGILICGVAILALGKSSLLPPSLTQYLPPVLREFVQKPDAYVGLKRATAGLRAAIAVGATQSQFSEKVQDVEKELILAKQQASGSTRDDVQLSLYDKLLDDCQKVLQTWQRRNRTGSDTDFATGENYDVELQTQLSDVSTWMIIIDTASTVK